MGEVMAADRRVGPPGSFFLDSAGILEAPNLTASQCQTTPEIVAEIRPGGATGRRLEGMLAAGLVVRSPGEAALETVRKAAKKSGALGRLSPADVSILALSTTGGPGGLLLSDDYTVLDVAARLGIAARPVTKPGIESVKSWGARCRGCGRRFGVEAAGIPCPVCGSEVRRVPVKESAV